MLALALLAAQFGAEVHAYSHLAKDPDSAPSSALYCAKCLSFAPVTVAAGGLPYLVLIEQSGAEPALAAATASIPASFRCHSYQSRAPPPLL